MTKFRIFSAFLLGVSTLPAQTIAQEAPPTSQGSELPGKASTSDEPYSDPDGAGAKAYAQRMGVSEAQVTKTLRLMHAAGLIGNKLVRENGTLFNGVSFENGKIRVFMKQAPLLGGLLSNLTTVIDPDLRSAVGIVPVKYSRQELRSRATALLGQLGEAVPTVGVRIGAGSNTVEILATNVADTESRVLGLLGSLPADTKVVQAEPIELAQDGYGGTAANTGVSSGCPTFGFIVVDTTSSSQDRGLLTVAHAATPSIDYAGWSAASLRNCRASGTRVSQRRSYSNPNTTNLGLDFAWYRNSS